MIPWVWLISMDNKFTLPRSELNLICHSIAQFPSWFLSLSSFLQGNFFFQLNVTCKNLLACCEFSLSFFLLLSSHRIWNCWCLYTSLGGSHLIDNRGRYLQYCMNINIKTVPLGTCMCCRSHWIWHRLGNVQARQSDGLSSLKEPSSDKSLLSATEAFYRCLFLLFTVRLPKAQVI